MATAVAQQFNVGGVLLDRPFKVRRLGHFGFNVVKMEESLNFYTKLLGFQVSDAVDFSFRCPEPDKARAEYGDTNGYFMHYGGDHHSFVMFNRRLREAIDTRRTFSPEVTINQISWQVASLREIVDAVDWLSERDMTIQRSGRDWPGSNWHTYFYDPDGHTNELFYGMEQIGWLGLSKPEALKARSFHERPPLPQMSEIEEVEQARLQGVDLYAAKRYLDRGETYDVAGVLLPRPFKVVRVGPMRLFVQDVDKAEAFYTSIMGFTKTEETTYDGQRCVFLRANMEHHSMALYPITLRKALGMSPHTTCLSVGLQVAGYSQLRNAIAFLKEQGCTVRELPPELSLGISYSAFVLDPDGHALELYSNMEQLGWDGRPRPAPARSVRTPGAWPETLPPEPDTFGGEVFMGPLG